MSRPLTDAEKKELIRLREEKYTFYEIAIRLKRRKQTVIDAYKEIVKPPPRPPVKKWHELDYMTELEYKRLRRKTYPSWRWVVTFFGYWAKKADVLEVQGNRHHPLVVKVIATSRPYPEPGPLEYRLHFIEAKELSWKGAMRILKDSEIYCVDYDVKVTRIKQFRKVK